MKDGGPAFPTSDNRNPLPSDGMSLRDYFAAQAMQAHILADAFLAAHAYAQGKGYEQLEPDDIAHLANQQADAMLKIRDAARS